MFEKVLELILYPIVLLYLWGGLALIVGGIFIALFLIIMYYAIRWYL